jgi:hypothetical protein
LGIAWLKTTAIPLVQVKCQSHKQVNTIPAIIDMTVS